jgi:hypothetical protein
MDRRTEVLHPDIPGTTLNFAPEQETQPRLGRMKDWK